MKKAAFVIAFIVLWIAIVLVSFYVEQVVVRTVGWLLQGSTISSIGITVGVIHK